GVRRIGHQSKQQSRRHLSSSPRTVGRTHHRPARSTVSRCCRPVNYRVLQQCMDMARIKLAYIGGGSTRAPGTMASLIAQGHNFEGSEIVLIDLDGERLEVVRTLADKMARDSGVDLRIRATTD